MGIRETELGIFPDEWTIDTMENSLCSIIDYRGKTPGKSDKGIKTLSAKSVKDGYIDYDLAYHISEETYTNFMVRGIPKRGDILMTTEAPLGLVARLDKDGIAIAQRLLTLRGKSNYLENDYLMYYLKSPIGQHQLNIRASGTTVSGIKQSEFRKVLITIPPIKEQKAISSILVTIDEKIDTNNKINKKLEKMAQAIFKQWFVDFEFPNEDGEPYKSSGGEMIESELGMIPKGWEVSKLEEIIYFNPKEVLKKDNEYKFVEMAAIDNNTSNIKYWELRKLNSGSKFRNGDTLLARITPCLENGKTAYISILEEKEVAVGSTEFIVMRGKEKNKKVYIYCLAREENFRAHAIKSMSGSSGRQRVQLDLLKGYKIVQAPNAIYDKFDRIGESLFEEISSLNKEITRLAKLRDLLLPKLMSGEIRVPVEVSES
ncbi:restriction endonuclease [Clostridium zeae]|uniref:Restriction endonuclease n=1 Tax=Clostridium zeae TaxID=2759022 RepID=A0ABQ1E5T5_9CLOT|nr:restriction endonuclease subunit S [Clostridium zeae]GFZ30109.1 restriction endonuclease [Clostridium zeae]